MLKNQKMFEWIEKKTGFNQHLQPKKEIKEKQFVRLLLTCAASNNFLNHTMVALWDEVDASSLDVEQEVDQGKFVFHIS